MWSKRFTLETISRAGYDRSGQGQTGPDQVRPVRRGPVKTPARSGVWTKRFEMTADRTSVAPHFEITGDWTRA